MVAIVTGNGLGLQASSALGLGGRGQVGSAGLGRNGEQAYVNAATGNLVLRDRDQWLIGRGADAELLRAYNSQGQLAGQAWRSGTSKQVGVLTGTLNTEGSTVERTDWDGTRIVYAWDAARSRYVAGRGAGTRDTLSWDEAASSWLWTQADGALREYYSPGEGGQVVRALDRDGNVTEYVYSLDSLDGSPPKLLEIRTANGEVTYLDYDLGLRLSQVRTVTQAQGGDRTATAVRYAYDMLGRLSTVAIDLSPDDNSVVDGKVFTTVYAYDGDSTRVASIEQSDGARVAFGYQQDDGVWRVASIAQTDDAGALRTTALSYDLANRRTVVTDPLGLDTILSYDEQGRLLQTSSPAVNGTRQTQVFAYDVAGQVASVRDGLGNEVKYGYDAAGNLIRQEDAVGTVVTRSYGAGNELLSETVTGPNAVATTTHYVYDSEGHLRFRVSAEGRVREYRYNAAGQQEAELSYSVGTYTGADKSEAALASWAGAQARIGERTDTAYDFRGQVASVTRYGTLRADGSGALDDKVLQTRYVYDAQGRLLQRFVGPIAAPEVEQFSYDGLGRVLTQTASNDSVTVTQYDDAQRQTKVSFSNGLLRTSTYSRTGELLAVAESGGGTVLSQVRYHYDRDGRLRMTEDALGARSHVLYDEAGRRVGEIDALGALTEYQYDANNQLSKTLRYANPVGATALAGLVDGNGKPRETATVNGATVALTLANAGVKPAADAANDRPEWRFYDKAGRLIKTVDARGGLIDYQYDASSRLIEVYEHPYALNFTQFKATPTLANATLPKNNNGWERLSRHFYDADGLHRGTMNSADWLTEYLYDAAGRKTQVVQYRLTSSSAPKYVGTLDQIRPSLIPYEGGEVRTRYLYDYRGLMTAEVDGEGYVTRYEYDSAGNVSRRTRGEKVTPEAVSAPKSVSGRFVARVNDIGTSPAPTVEVWVDGAMVRSFSIDQASGAQYLFSANVVPGVNHQVALVVKGLAGRELWVKDASFAEASFDAVWGSAWDSGGTGQTSGVVELRPSGEVHVDHEGALRWFVPFTDTLATIVSIPGMTERTDYRYDVDGRLLKTTEYSSSGDAVSVYKYDGMGRQVEGRRAARGEYRRFDLQGRLIAQLSGEGAKALDALGDSPSQADVDSVWAEWGVRREYDASGHLVATTDPLGRSTLYYYDSLGRNTHTVNPMGEVVEQRYNVFGEISQKISYALRIAPQTLGQMRGGSLSQSALSTFAQLDNAQASRTLLSYAVNGVLSELRDAMGASTEYSSSVFNEISSERTWTKVDKASSDLIVTNYSLSKLGLVTQTTVDALGLKLVQWTHREAFGRISVAAASIDYSVGYAASSTTQYDRAGNVVQDSHWLGTFERMTYDAYGNVVTKTDRVGSVTRYSYTAFNREVRVKTPENIETVTRYNEYGQVVELIDGNGAVTKYEYDLDGNLLSEIGPQGTSRSLYDRVGQVIEAIDKRGTRVTYEYDAAGRVLQRTLDPNGLSISTRYEYDAKGQLVREVGPDGSATSISYDLNGRKALVVVDAGEGRLNLTTSFEYDAKGNLSKVTEGLGTSSARVTAHSYDKGGRRVSTTVDPDGLALKTQFYYDERGLVVAERNAKGSLSRFVYSQAGLLTHTIDASGAVKKREYDADGRLVRVTAYAEKVDLTGVPDVVYGYSVSSQIEAKLRPDSARDQVDRFVYDRDGRIRYQLDGFSNVVESVYDRSGNVVRRVAYATAIGGSTAMTTAGVAAVLSAQSAQAHAADRVEVMTYDAAGRLTYKLDAARYITQYVYDANGNLTQQVRISKAYPMGMQEDAPGLAYWANVYRYGSSGTRWVYDAAGRAIWEVRGQDGALDAAQTVYDASGRRVKKIAYSSQIPWNWNDFSRSGLESWAASTSDGGGRTAHATTQWYYDGAGRQVFAHDALGYVTESQYDAVGAVTKSIRYQDAISANHFESLQTVRSRLGAGKTLVEHRYDSAGRTAETVDAAGVVTHREYDGVGRVIAEFAAWGTSLSVKTGRSYDSLGRLIEETKGAGTDAAATSRYAYDAFGNRLSSVDPRGVELSEQDTEWALAQRRALGYVNETGAVLRAADLSASQRLELLARYTTKHVYDKEGHEVETIDPFGASTAKKYDAFGDVSEIKDALGRVGYFFHDGLGRTVAQVDPEDYLTTTEYDSLGNAVAVRRYSGRVQGWTDRSKAPIIPQGDVAQTKMWYDALGRLTQIEDAEGGVESYGYDAYGNRTIFVSKLGGYTQYKFDLLDRMVEERINHVVLNGGGPLFNRFAYDYLGNLVKKTEAHQTSEQRETQYTYDALNRVATSSTRVALGQYPNLADAVESFRYDPRGNLIEKVAANNARTVYYYDANNRLAGQVDPNGLLTVNRYDDAGNLIRTRAYEQPVALPAGWALPAPPVCPVREKQFEYDANNRLTRSITFGALHVEQNTEAGYAYQINTNSEIQEVWEYDLNGRLVRHTDANRHSGYTFYNALGQKRFEVDAGGYATAWERDAEGNVTKETRFAQSRGNQTYEPGDLDRLLAEWPTSADDRITLYSYDKMGRRLTESRLGVAYGTVDPASGQLTTAFGTATTAYAYDKAGNLLRRTDANGSVFGWEYDKAGRNTAMFLPGMTDYAGRSVAARTEYKYNGLHQIVSETRIGVSSTENQTTMYWYGAGGRLIQKSNALGYKTEFDYDAVGNMTAMRYRRTKSSGQWYTETIQMSFDQSGREIQRVTVSNDGSRSAERRTRYNLFGDVTGRGTGPSGWQEFADYDIAGRMIRSNMNGGITKMYLYDGNGNAAVEVESQTQDLRNFSLEDVMSGLGDTSHTLTFYDERNNVIDVVQASMTAEGERLGLKPRAIDTTQPGKIQTLVGGHLGGQPIPAQYGAADGDPHIAPASASSQTPITTDHAYSYWPGGTDNHPPTVMPYRFFIPDYRSVFGSSYDIRIVLEGVETNHYAGADIGTYPLGGQFVGNQDVRFAEIHIDTFLENISGSVRFATLAFQLKVYVTPHASGGGRELEVGASNQVQALMKWDADWDRDSRVDVESGSLASTIYLTPPAEYAGEAIELPIDAYQEDIAPQIYVRPWGSTGAYQSLWVQRDSAQGKATVDVAALADGSYEVLYLAERNNGTLTRREQFQLQIGGTQSITRIADAPSDAYRINGLGSFVWTGTDLHLVALRDRSGRIPASATIQYRAKGSQGPWIGTAPLDGMPPFATPGSFRFGAAGLAGDYEIVLTLRDGQGEELESLSGEIGVGATPRVGLDFAHDAEVIRFANLPPNAATMSFLLQRADGSTAATVPATAIVNRELIWSIPPELMAEVGGGVQSYTLVATLTDNLVVPPTTYGARGTVQIGPQRQPSSVVAVDQHLYTLPLDPGLSEGQVLVLHFRPEGDNATSFTQVTILRGADGKYRWDSLGLNPALTYEYYYDVYHTVEDAQNPAGAQSLVRNNGYFWADVDRPANEARWVFEIPEGSNRVIHRRQEFNAFGEIATETDGRGHTTTLSYNTLGKLTRKTDPLVQVTRANGFQEEINPVTEFVYDRIGSVVAYRDANGNLTTQAWNYGTAQPTLKTEWHPDGGVKQFGLDVFGNLRVSTDENGRRTDYTYDAGNRLVRLDRPVLASGERAWETYAYDELDHRIRHSNVLGTETTDFSIEGEVSRTVSAAGRTTVYSASWDAAANDGEGAWRRVTTDANGRSTTDWIDARGRKYSHTDLGGRTFAYQYNTAGLLVSAGLAGQTERQTQYQYYRNGLLKRMTDTASGIAGYYEYDENGNRTFEGFTGKGGGWAFQQSKGSYDALNRLVRIHDPRYEIDYEFDAQGNRIRVRSVYKDGINGATAVQDYWYVYDSMNRFVVTMGQLSSGGENRGASADDAGVRVVAGGPDGVAIGYDGAGQRRMATYSDGHVERYEYDAMGYLTDTTIDDVLRARRVNDLAGRVVDYHEYAADGALRSSITHTWDADSLLQQDHDNLANKGTKTFRLADGTVDYTQTYGEATTLKTSFSYDWYDSARQTEVKVQASNESSPKWAPGFSRYVYDEQGRIKLAYDQAGNRGFAYQTDGEGRILQRDELMGGQVDASGNVANATQNRHHSYYLFDDRQVGNVGNDGIDRIDYAKELAQHEAAAGAKNDQRHKRFTPVAGADFDQNYQPINSLYPTAAPGSYLVRAGDTLQSIATALWGDGAMWYLLADANGLAPNQPLIANTVLTVPNKVTNIHNNASTFKPYDAGEAMGNTSPTVPDPPPPPAAKKGCGGFVKVLAIIVAVVVTIYTAGAAAAAMSSTLATGGALGATMSAGLGVLGGTAIGGLGTGALIGAAAIGGAVGSIASQAVLIAGGVQDKFDWKGVALSAVGAGVTAGVGASGLPKALMKTGLNDVGRAAVMGGVNSAVNQTIAVATGLQDSFDWKGVAISAVSAGAGEFVGGKIDALGKRLDWNPKITQHVARFGAGMTAGTVSAAARGNLSSQVLTSVGLDALASTVGYGIADRAAASSAGSSSLPFSQAREDYDLGTEGLFQGAQWSDGEDAAPAIFAARGALSTPRYSARAARSLPVLTSLGLGGDIRDLSPLMVTTDERFNDDYMQMWAWSARYRMAAPPRTTSQAVLNAHRQQQYAATAPNYYKWLDSTYTGPRPGASPTRTFDQNWEIAHGAPLWLKSGGGGLVGVLETAVGMVGHSVAGVYGMAKDSFGAQLNLLGIDNDYTRAALRGYGERLTGLGGAVRSIASLGVAWQGNLLYHAGIETAYTLAAHDRIGDVAGALATPFEQANRYDDIDPVSAARLRAGAVFQYGVAAVTGYRGLVSGAGELAAFGRAGVGRGSVASTRALSKFDGLPTTGVAVLDAPAVQSSSFSQKLDAMRRAGFSVIEDADFMVARGQFDGTQFTYNPQTMTRLDFAHEWRHFHQLNQMIERGLSPEKSMNMRIAQAPAERGAYLYEEKLWSRIGEAPSIDYMRFHTSQVDFFEQRMYDYRSFVAKSYNAKWRGINW